MSLPKREIRGTRISVMNNLTDAFWLVEQQDKLSECVIRINGDTVCGDILVRNRKEIVDALINDLDIEANKALIQLLSISRGRFEVLKLTSGTIDACSDQPLNIKLDVLARDIQEFIKRDGLPLSTVRDFRELVDQSAPFNPRRERPIKGKIKGEPEGLKLTTPDDLKEQTFRERLFFASLVVFALCGLVWLNLPKPKPAPGHSFATLPAAPPQVNSAGQSNGSTMHPAPAVPTVSGVSSASTPSAVSATAAASKVVSPSSTSSTLGSQEEPMWKNQIWKPPVGLLPVPSDEDTNQALAVIEAGKSLEERGQLEEAVLLYQDALRKYPGVLKLRLAAIRASKLWIQSKYHAGAAAP